MHESEMNAQQIREAKKAIRKSIREIRDSLEAPDSSCIVSAIKELPEWKEADVAALYCALPGEVDLSDLLSASGKTLVLPLVKGDILELKEYVPGSLVKGYAGIWEPSDEAPSVNPDLIRFALIPGVAFDASCRRLGRGRGFYDRLLPSLNCPLAGVAFSWQMVPCIPSDPWDVPLDLVVTERQTYRRQASPLPDRTL